MRSLLTEWMCLLLASSAYSEPPDVDPARIFLVATNEYMAIVNRFCQIYNTGDDQGLFTQIDTTAARTPERDHFRLKAFMNLYTNISGIQTLPIGSITNPAGVWIQVGIAPLDRPKYPMLYRCVFNGDLEGYMQFMFRVLRGHAVSNTCEVLMGLTNPTDSERRRVINIIMESDK